MRGKAEVSLITISDGEMRAPLLGIKPTGIAKFATNLKQKMAEDLILTTSKRFAVISCPKHLIIIKTSFASAVNAMPDFITLKGSPFPRTWPLLHKLRHAYLIHLNAIHTYFPQFFRSVRDGQMRLVCSELVTD